ncbi:hypothetical protein Btru_037128 [Bulinus truncatus]|nr:hypothetical protein Btru_037128 [Bulinus truncatus]
MVVLVSSPIAVSISSPIVVLVSSPFVVLVSSSVVVLVSSPIVVLVSSQIVVLVGSQIVVLVSSPIVVLVSSPVVVLASSQIVVLVSSPMVVLVSSPIAVSISSPIVVLVSSPFVVLVSSSVVVLVSSPIVVLVSSQIVVLVGSQIVVLVSSPIVVLVSSPVVVLVSGPIVVLVSSPIVVLSSYEPDLGSVGKMSNDLLAARLILIIGHSRLLDHVPDMRARIVLNQSEQCDDPPVLCRWFIHLSIAVPNTIDDMIRHLKDPTEFNNYLGNIARYHIDLEPPVTVQNFKDFEMMFPIYVQALLELQSTSEEILLWKRLFNLLTRRVQQECVAAGLDVKPKRGCCNIM